MKLAVCILIPLLDQRLANEETYLSVSRRNDPTQWCVPGGKVDPGEDAVTALIRETWEELGVRVLAADLVPIYSAVCPGQGPGDTYWATAYLWLRPAGTLLQSVVTEPGFESAWCNEALLTTPSKTPFAQYNVGLFEAYRQYAGCAADEPQALSGAPDAQLTLKRWAAVPSWIPQSLVDTLAQVIEREFGAKGAAGNYRRVLRQVFVSTAAELKEDQRTFGNLKEQKC